MENQALVFPKPEELEIPVVELIVPEAKGKKVKVKVDMPSGLAIRVFKTGKSFFTKEILDFLKLEGNCIDVFDSKEWNDFPKEIKQSMLCHVRPKEANGDMFNNVKVKEIKSTQTTFKERLLSLVNNYNDFQDKDFIDFSLVGLKLSGTHNVFNLPKLKKGKKDEKDTIITVQVVAGQLFRIIAL